MIHSFYRYELKRYVNLVDHLARSLSTIISSTSSTQFSSSFPLVQSRWEFIELLDSIRNELKNLKEVQPEKEEKDANPDNHNQETYRHPRDVRSSSQSVRRRYEIGRIRRLTVANHSSSARSKEEVELRSLLMRSIEEDGLLRLLPNSIREIAICNNRATSPQRCFSPALPD